MSVGAITELQVFQAMERSAETAGSSNSLAMRFADLLSAEPPARPLAEVGAPSALSSVINTQESAYRKLNHDIMLAADKMPEMSIQQSSAVGVQLAFRVAQWDMFQTACTKLTQSAKNGVQTLMKNQ